MSRPWAASCVADRGRGIRDKLKKKGFTHERATQFAKRSQKTAPGVFGKSAAA